MDGVVAELRGVSEGGLLLPQHEQDHLFREEYSCAFYPGDSAVEALPSDIHHGFFILLSGVHVLCDKHLGPGSWAGRAGPV